jgi:hypothetical protein
MAAEAAGSGAARGRRVQGIRWRATGHQFATCNLTRRRQARLLHARRHPVGPGTPGVTPSSPGTPRTARRSATDCRSAAGVSAARR